MAARGLYKCIFPNNNFLVSSLPLQTSVCFQNFTVRHVSSNPSPNAATEKVHRLKHKLSNKVQAWHKVIPFQAIRKKLANKEKPYVAVLNLHGQIAAESGKGSAIGGRQSLNINSTRKQIESSFATPKLEAVLLSINSPGGSPAQSELISDYIQLLSKEKNVKVYSFVQDVAASGGYWLACAGEQIYITENSIVGSIGVISATFGFQDAVKYLNIEPRIQTAGEKKVLNNPFLPQREDDVEKTRKILDKLHSNFKMHVTKNRGEKIKQQDHNTLFSGEYWVGRDAIELGLADGVGNIDTFIRREFGGPDNINVKESISPMSKLQKLLGASYDGSDNKHSSDLEQILLMKLIHGEEFLKYHGIRNTRYEI